MRITVLFFLIILCLFSCSTESETSECVEAPESVQSVSLQVESLEHILPSIQSKSELVEFLTHYPLIRDQVLHRQSYPDDSTFINTLYQRFTNPHIDSLLLETQRVFGNQSILQKEFEDAFANLQHYYPELPLPKIQTLITGFDTDLFISDTLIIVGLDYYLGPGAKYRPNMYEYILQQYIPQNIVPSVMLLYGIDGRINATNMNDRTVLADMIAYGKSFYFAKRMLPCTPDSILINYTRKDIEGSKKNQDLIWFRLVEDKVLYSTANQVKQHYLGERPKTVEVGPECPGRIGQWVGWLIVNSYMKSHKETTLQELMKVEDADKLFKESKYKANRR
jgi:hypothetical protein